MLTNMLVWLPSLLFTVAAVVSQQLNVRIRGIAVLGATASSD